MRSSTSNSEWVKTWVLALTLAAGFLGGWECVLRAMGHKPTIVDGPSLWSYWREQAKGDKVLVVLGDSRPQLGWSNAASEKELPGYRAIQLAVGGLASPVAVLRDLAEDPGFRGIVVVCIAECGFVPELWDLQAPYVACYRNRWHLNDRLNLAASCTLHDSLVLLHPTLKLDQLMIHAAKYKTLPSVFYLDTFLNRNSVADYSRANLDEVRELNLSHARRHGDKGISASEWLASAMALEPYVEAIQGRGGRVVYVRYPTAGELWQRDEEAYPKQEFWDALARKTGAMCIHFKDYPSLSCYACPDFSHLNYDDVEPFTAALVRIVAGRGVAAAP